MKKSSFLSLFTFLGLLLISVSSCSQSNEEQANSTETITNEIASVYSKVPLQEFLSEFENADNPIMLDIRTPEEVAQGTIPNATVMNFYDRDFQSKLNEMDKDKPLFLYCKSGGRSGKALEMCRTMGFKEVYDLVGGYTAYAASQNAKQD